MAAKPSPQRKVPQRTCVACRRVETKRQLVRLVRTAEGSVMVDPTGKAAGRGAYLCADRACWTAALKRGALDRALKVTLDAAAQARLLEHAQQFSDTDTVTELAMN